MTISLINAIKAIKEDEHWIKKVLIGGLLSLFVCGASYVVETDKFALTAKAAAFCLYLIFSFFVSGFIVSTGNKILNSDSNKMTEWSEPNLLVKGLKFVFSWIAYSFVICIIFCVISVLLSIIAGIVLGIIYYLIITLLHIDIKTAAPLLFVIFGVLYTVFILYLMQFINTAYTCYLKNLSFKNLISLKKHFAIIKENRHAAWTLIGKEILYILLFILIFTIAIITIIGIVLIPFICFAAKYVILNMYTQFGKQIEIGKYFE